MFIGESFVGSGANAAHINVVLGPREGPVGAAWASALASPSAGHVPFMVVLQPGVPVKPVTVFINKAALSGETHERMTWGPAQAGVARGVQERMLDGSLPPEAADVGNRHAVNPQGRERVFHVLELEDSHDCFDFFHNGILRKR